MDALEAIRTRRSIRKYKDRPVEKEKLEKVLEAARWAPSAGNLQDREFVVIDNERKRKELVNVSMLQPFVLEAPVVILVCVNYRRIAPYGRRGEELYTVQGSAAAIQNLMLAANALGLGTCWIGAFREDRVSSLLNLPEHVRPVAVITLGYADEKPSSDRRPVEELVSWNRYSS